MAFAFLSGGNFTAPQMRTPDPITKLKSLKMVLKQVQRESGWGRGHELMIIVDSYLGKTIFNCGGGNFNDAYAPILSPFYPLSRSVSRNRGKNDRLRGP